MQLRLLLLSALLCAVNACTPRAPAVVASADAGVVEAAPPALDPARVLALVSENAPGAAVSIQPRGADVGLEIRGHSGPTVALAQLASLPPKFPGLTATRLQLDESGWTATLTATAAPSAVPTDPTALTAVLAAASPVFTGEARLLSTGAVDVTPTLLSFKGVLAPGRGIADAALVIAPGYALRKVETGPPFVLEIAR